MRVDVDFQGSNLEFEIEEERVVARWGGPEGLDPSAASSAIAGALEHPQDFPAFRQMLVPGDQVALVIDPGIPGVGAVVEAVIEVLGRAGVDRETITIVAPAGAGAGAGLFPEGRVEVHDPDDRSRIAYLASTRAGRRVYLNRSLTDADVVVPVGRLRHNVDGGHRGPWSLLYPGMSDRSTMQAFRGGDAGGSAEARQHRHEAQLEEVAEVSWLLGSQFHVGILEAASGMLEIIAGRDATVRDRGIAAIERHWTMEAPERAELVVAGVGFREDPGDRPATLEDLAAAIETAAGLVRRGGRMVVLSRASGPIGPALQRLATLDDPSEAPSALRELESAEDYPIARRIARAAAWADLFVASGLDPDLAEGLSIVPIEKPEQARRLAAAAGSVTFVGHAEMTRARVRDE